MDAIANWIAENPYFTAAGLFATFLGLIIAIIVPIVQRRRKQLYYTTSTTQLVNENISNIKDIEILFCGKQINQLSVTNMKIWNSGNVLITNDDMYLNHELQVIPQGTFNCTILDVDIISQSTDTIQCIINSYPDKANIIFQAFEKKDFVSFNVYHTGDENVKFILDGKIKEGKIVNKTIDVEEQLSMIAEIGSFSIFSLPDMIRLIFYIQKKSRK